MSNYRKIFIGLLIIIGLVFLGYKYYSYLKLNKLYDSLTNSELANYYDLFSLEFKREPNSLDEFKSFLKPQNEVLYNLIELSELNYSNDEPNNGIFYLKGFDNVDNKLSKIVILDDLNFFKSLFLKGDIVVGEKGGNWHLPFNFIYKIHKGGIKEMDTINWVKFYENYLNCPDGIKLKQSSIGKDQNSFEIRVQNGEIKIHPLKFIENDNEPSDNTKILIKEYIANSKYFRVKDSVYLYLISIYNIEDIECVN